MGDPSMSYSFFNSSIDSITQWIDTSLVSDPALTSLMESYNSQPSHGFEFTSNSSVAQDTFAITTNHASMDNFELANGCGNRHALAGAERKASIVRSDATSESISTAELPSQAQERPALDEVAKGKKEKRRAQNRKAQQAFRQRKDTAIAQLEKEMEKLKCINQELSQINRARLQEISELKSRLGALRLTPLSPSIDGQEDEEKKKAEQFSSFCVQPSYADDPITTNTIPWIKWRGRLYTDSQAPATSSTEICWSSAFGSPTGPVQRSAREI